MNMVRLFLLAAALLAPAANAAAAAFQWMRTYSGAANQDDYGYGVAVAADGSVYVTGSTYVSGQGNNLLLRKYSAKGAPQWMRIYNGAASQDDRGYGVAVAADGSVYVTGSTYVNGQDDDLLLRKYSANGTPRWMRTYDGEVNGHDRGYGVAVAADGSVYVSGETGVSGQGGNLLLRKYSADGTVHWSKSYNGSANNWDYGYGIAAAPDGSVYVTGGAEVSGRLRNLILRKYSADGTVQWMKTYNGTANGNDGGLGVAAASDGSVYVTGWTDVSGQSVNLLLRKHSADGTALWTRTYNGPASGYDAGVGVALAPEGGVYVAGATDVTGQFLNLLLRKYTANGALQWMRTYNGAAGGDEFGFGVAVAPDGSVYVAGSTDVSGQQDDLLLRKYK